MKNFVNHHSMLEKTLHRVAFRSFSSSLALSRIESRLYRQPLAAVENKRPVFLTALPRAGTTLLLELCVGTRQFVSHTYGDMPFLLLPLFWNHFAKYFQQASIPRERVHGDGIMVNEQSPEAFEEILWQGFWPSRYHSDRIVPWSALNYPTFEQFFDEHLRKLIWLRGNSAPSQARYISKNNLNIARIPYLKHLFPDATIVVLFRNPIQHAASLLRQHRNFLAIHQADPFAQRYMADTGHYDFGANLRPVDFDQWLSTQQPLDFNTFDFWLHYWIHTYQYLLKHVRDHVTFCSYDALCRDPEGTLCGLANVLEIEHTEAFMKNAARITTPNPYDVDRKTIATGLLEQAEALFLNLQNIAS